MGRFFNELIPFFLGFGVVQTGHFQDEEGTLVGMGQIRFDVWSGFLSRFEGPD